MYFFSSAGLIACKDLGFFEAFSCPWTPSPTFYKLLEIERLRREGHVSFGRILATFWTSWTALDGRGCRLLSVRFGLAGRFVCVAAHDLLDAERERAPLLGADQR